MREESMARYTTLGVGGKTTVREIYAVKELAELPDGNVVLGGGSNVLIGETKLPVFAVNKTRGRKFYGDKAYFASGEKLSAICRAAAERGLGGMEWAAGLPGTAGGAVAGNAGTAYGDMASAVDYVDISRGGRAERLSAEECGFSLSELAQKPYSLDEELPWDFIDTGLSKDWLKNEYKEAFAQGCEFNHQPTCENKCVQCGVCPSLKTHKVMAKPYKASDEAQKIMNIVPQDPARAHLDPNIPIYRYRIKVTKKGILRYFSHLDWQNTFHKVLARSGLNMVFTLGFNPTMKVSMGIALPLFAESEGELVDIEIYDNLSPEEIKTAINPNLPQGAEVIEVKQIDRRAPAVDIEAHWAEYRIAPYNKSNENMLYNFEKFRYDIDKVLSCDKVLITKKNKKGFEKTTDFKKSIGTHRFEGNSLFICLKVGQGSDIPALRADDLMKLVNPNQIFDIARVRFLTENLNEI